MEATQFMIFGYPVEIKGTDDNDVDFEAVFANEISTLNYAVFEEDQPSRAFWAAQRGVWAETSKKPISGRYFVSQKTFDKCKQLFTICEKEVA